MTKHQLTVFLGDVQDYLAGQALAHDASAWLLDQSNYKTLDTKRQAGNVTVYTSLGDLSKDLTVVHFILSQANTIFYCPPLVWSDNKKVDVVDPGSSIQGLTEILLLLLPASVEVVNFSPFSPAQSDPRALIDQRKTDSTQLWVAGCSISHGVGINPTERYGELLAKDLALPCSFLTRPGAAIDWAADQILRSDIKIDDLVVWGITAWNRLTYIHNNQLLEGVNVSTYKTFPEYNDIISINQLLSDQTLYNHYYSIQQVINYCKKIKAKLFIVGLLPANYSLLGFLKSLENYIHIPYTLTYNDSMLFQKFEDLGDDLLHPGPKQHQTYKNTILDFINQHN
jgi:hypothetical protein